MAHLARTIDISHSRSLSLRTSDFVANSVHLSARPKSAAYLSSGSRRVIPCRLGVEVKSEETDDPITKQSDGSIPSGEPAKKAPRVIKMRDRPDRPRRQDSGPQGQQNGAPRAMNRGDRERRPDRGPRPKFIRPSDKGFAAEQNKMREERPAPRGPAPDGPRAPQSPGASFDDGDQGRSRPAGRPKGGPKGGGFARFEARNAAKQGGSGDKGSWKGPGRRVQKKIDIKQRRKARKERKEERQASIEVTVKAEILEVPTEGMSVEDLSVKLGLPTTEILKTLFLKGVMATGNQTLDKETVTLVADEHEVVVLDEEEAALEAMARKTVEYVTEDDLELLETRPPVATIMGHVDHGKTSLLDYIRKTKVAAGEAGGITQAIGAYQCEFESAGETKLASFLDTPGHEAFSSMRARGARVTDVAIIIVAADDGVRPQTIEAVSHAQAAKVPIIVAINKIDKEGANPERAKQELSEIGLLPEEWGGETPMIPISAKTGEGVDTLLETLSLLAEMEELQANPEKAASGTILEANLDRYRGPKATLLVQAGTLRTGDVIHSGAAHGKVRSMTDHKGDPIDQAGPSTPVQILGLSIVPNAGDQFEVLESESEARERAEEVEYKARMERLAEQSGGGFRVTLAGLSAASDLVSDDGELTKLNIILKADTSGSIEAIKAALGSIPQDKVILRFLMAATGDITNSDVDLAAASEGIVFGFNAQLPEAVVGYAKEISVEVRNYDVIYDMLDEVRSAMEGLLPEVTEKVFIGEAEVRAVFGTGSKSIAGCYVSDGKIRKGSVVEVLRGDKLVYEGPLSSLRRIKEAVNEVSQGIECGVGTDGFSEWKEGDLIKSYALQQKMQTLEYGLEEGDADDGK